MRIVINPTYETMRQWISTLPETFSQSGEVIYDARNQIRVIDTPWGRMNVKRYHQPMWLNRIVYSTLRTPKCVRAYKNALRLQALKIDTPEAIAYLILQRGGLITESYLVTRQSPLARRMYEFREHGAEGHEAIIDHLATLSARMHTLGVYHKDYSPGNILFDVEDGEVKMCVVDINRMEFNTQPIGLRKSCRNFARLWGNEEFFDLLADRYAKERGWEPTTCRTLIKKYHERFWRHRT